MCGICGYVGTHDPNLLEAMSLRMQHRGPDDAGIWFDEQRLVGFGHRRLSIIDLNPRGRQPMCNEDSSIWLTFNGEIYNYPELREDLIKRGHKFRSETDSEVLVHLYEERGEDMLQKLNGMFAFAIFDRNSNSLMVARDHAGIKPLYYCVHKDAFYFASELKALLVIPGLPREINIDVIPEYLTFLWVAGEQTMMKSVMKLEPGHVLNWKNGKLSTKRWYNPIYEPDETITFEDAAEMVHDELMRTVKRQMVADVPLGAFLSGGVDSSVLVACMRHLYPDRPISCYTIRSRAVDNKYDDLAEDHIYAKKVAEHLRVELKVFDAEPNMMELLPRIVWHLDEPDADPAAILSCIICKAARENGTTVLLSGTGGDEVFFGYRSHQAMRQYQRLNGITGRMVATGTAIASAGVSFLLGPHAPTARRLTKFRSGLLARELQRHIALVDWASPEARARIYTPPLKSFPDPRIHPPPSFARYFAEFSGSGPISRHSHVLINTFLAAHNFLYTDRSSMASAMEVRVPYMDLELVKLCARFSERHKIQLGRTKPLLEAAMSRYLPREVFTRSKAGFGVPLRKWMSRDLSVLRTEYLCPSLIESRGLFDASAVGRLVTEHRSNRGDHAYLIYAMISLELWMQAFLDIGSTRTSAQAPMSL